MKNKTKIWIIVATCLVVIGVTIFAATMSANGWNFNLLATNNYVTNTHDIKEEFKNISIDIDTADITFKLDNANQPRIECFDEENVKYSVLVADDTLKISLVDNRKWYEHIGINFENSKITIYLPKEEYAVLSIKTNTSDIEIPKEFKFDNADISVSTGDVNLLCTALDFIKIKSTTGDICVQDIEAKMLDVSVSTGKIIAENISCVNDVKMSVDTGKASLKNVSCQNLVSNGNTGDLILQNVIAKEKFSLERNTGDIKFEACDANELLIKTDTGDIKGTLLTDKIFITNSDTGSIDVPKTTVGGKCEVTTDTGDINLSIK